MRVLFVSSGNSGKISALVKNQGNSLAGKGVEISYYLIQGKGVLGYLRNVRKIRNAYKKGNFDIVHAHYSLSAFAASMAGGWPLVVSLMGSDVYCSRLFRVMVKIFYWLFWDKTIVKTKEMKALLKLNKAVIIPNGVDLERFKIISMELARKKICFPSNRRLILFFADPIRTEKNFDLARIAVKLIDNKAIELLAVYNVPNEDVPYYINAADVLLVTSKWEGSVNVVKEAMACNCPVVSTDVGDVKWVIGNTDGCFVSSSKPEDVADKLTMALEFSNANRRTCGRERILELELDSESIANRLLNIYNLLIESRIRK